METPQATDALRVGSSELLAAVVELLAVAERRQDNVLPMPPDDPKLWCARMQEAWDELREVADAIAPGEVEKLKRELVGHEHHTANDKAD